MKRLLPFFFLAATAALPATSVTPAGQTGLALLSQVGTVLPATCAVGQLFFKSDATAGQNIYMCGSANTWTQGSGGGSGGGSGPCSAFGTSAGTCAQGNDSRITGAYQSSSFGTGVATAAGNNLNAAGGLLGFSASFGQGLVTGTLFGDNYAGGETDESKWHFGYLDPSTAQTTVAALINPFSAGDKVHAYICHNVGMTSAGAFLGTEGAGKADDGTGNGYCTFWTDNGYRITLGFAAPGANAAIAWNTTAGEIADAVNSVDSGTQTLKNKTVTRPTITIQTLTCNSATPTWDLSAGNMGVCTLNGYSITPTITNAPVGGSVAFKIVQDSTARTIPWPAGDGTTTLKVKWPSGVPPTLTVTSGHIDDVTCNVWTAYLWDCVWAGDFQ